MFTRNVQRIPIPPGDGLKWGDHGIPAGAFGVMRTDWSKRWPDAAKMANKDSRGVAHYQEWSLPSLKYLDEERKIAASGHETTDTAPGLATTKEDYSLEANKRNCEGSLRADGGALPNSRLIRAVAWLLGA